VRGSASLLQIINLTILVIYSLLDSTYIIVIVCPDLYIESTDLFKGSAGTVAD
jgi:hypothetical protein